MPLILRLLLVMLASALIMGARLLARQCLSWQPAQTAMPLRAGAEGSGSFKNC